jgi:prophage regulatory protein
MSTTTATTTRYYRMKHILSDILPVNESTIWRWVKDDKFPKPMKLADKVTVWDAQEVDAWVRSQRGEQPAPLQATAPAQAPATKGHAKGLKVAA